MYFCQEKNVPSTKKNVPSTKKNVPSTKSKNKVFFVEKNSLVACFDDKVDISILDEISKVAPLKICLRESSFIKDQDKINFFERLKKLSPDTETTII